MNPKEKQTKRNESIITTFGTREATKTTERAVLWMVQEGKGFDNDNGYFI